VPVPLPVPLGSPAAATVNVFVLAAVPGGDVRWTTVELVTSPRIVIDDASIDAVQPFGGMSVSANVWFEHMAASVLVTSTS
jgi:hypothetical protein